MHSRPPLLRCGIRTHPAAALTLNADPQLVAGDEEVAKWRYKSRLREQRKSPR